MRLLQHVLVSEGSNEGRALFLDEPSLPAPSMTSASSSLFGFSPAPCRGSVAPEEGTMAPDRAL